VLAVNKLDRFFLELQLEPEEIYQGFCRAIESVNAIIATHPDEELGEVSVYAERGTVAFTAGKQGWGFTLKQFAKVYAKKFGVDDHKLVGRLWGDNYYDKAAKKWTTSPVSSTGQPLPRAFCQFIVEPISRMFQACLNSNIPLVEQLTNAIGVNVSADEKQLPGKDLLKLVMQRWLPAADALLEMITTNLPSPAVAQKYRVGVLYSGPLDDPTAESIRKCDPEGPLVVFISKMVPTKDNSRFFAFGRVFSGTVASGQKVRVLGPNYVHGKKEDLFTGNKSPFIQILIVGRRQRAKNCGNDGKKD
jgi:elongation factor 2